MKNTRSVYSTESGRIPEPGRGRPAIRSGRSGVPDDGIVRIFLDRSGRNGKVVTVIRGLPRRDMDARAAELKRLCGAGGAVKEDAVEIQGDHRDRIADALRAHGYTVKLAGG